MSAFKTMDDGCEPEGSPPLLGDLPTSPRTPEEEADAPVFVTPEGLPGAEAWADEGNRCAEGELAGGQHEWLQEPAPAPSAVGAASSAQDLGFSMLYDHGAVRHSDESGATQNNKGKLRKGPGAALSSVLRRRPSTIVPDDAVSECMNCRKEFHMGLRRHHCRWCAFVTCLATPSPDVFVYLRVFSRPISQCCATHQVPESVLLQLLLGARRAATGWRGRHGGCGSHR